MILGNTSHLTHTLFLFCCGDILKSHKEDFPDLDIPELQQSPSHWAPNSCHSVNGLALSILLSSLQTPFFCKGEGCKQLGLLRPRGFILPEPQHRLSSGMVKGEPYWQASVSSPPLKGEPCWPLVSSPPRLSPHVTSSSRPTKDGRWGAWSGTPPWLSVSLCHPRS